MAPTSDTSTASRSDVMAPTSDTPTASRSDVNLWNKSTTALAATSGVLLLLLVIMVAGCVYFYLQARRHSWSWLGKDHTENKLAELDLEIITPKLTAQAKLRSLLGSTFNEEMLYKLDKLWIPRNSLKITDQIGKGAFGTVWKAYRGKKVKRHIVAVKSFKGSGDNEDLTPIFKEALVMGDLRHRHVLGLLGVAFDDGLSLPLLVLPFMHNGNLCSYLRSFRHGELADVKPPEPQQLVVFAQQIARGMEYLAGQNIVHRDLACRNCMVGSDLVVKVADFGLAKDVCGKNYYRQMRESRLPVKWLAVESLSDRLFHTKSDVWAYGVTLWEIFTMGRTPYPSLNNSQLLMYLKSGGRLGQPTNCCDEIFSLMMPCWSVRPSDRPTFTELAEKIEDYLASVMDYLQLNHLVYTENCDGVQYYNVPTHLSPQKPLDADFEDKDNEDCENDNGDFFVHYDDTVVIL